MTMDQQNSASGGASRKLYKSTSERIIDGVCGGIAEYFEVDASVIRLVLIAMSIISFGAGVLFYIIAMLVIPAAPIEANPAESTESSHRASGAGATATLVAGIIIVIIGITLLFNYYSIFSVASLWHYFGRLALPVIFILIGGALLIGREKKGAESLPGTTAPSGPVTFGEVHDEGTYAGVEKKRLARSVRDKKIAGVCGGLAEYLEADPTIVRLVFVLLAFASFGLAIVLYIVCAFVIPKEVKQ